MSLTILDSSPAYPGPPLSSPSFLVLIVDMILLLFLIERAIGRKKLNRPMPRGETLAGTISLVLAIFSSSVFLGQARVLLRRSYRQCGNNIFLRGLGDYTSRLGIRRLAFKIRAREESGKKTTI